MIARQCESCGEARQLFAIREDGKKLTHFVLPGRIVDPGTRALVFESEAYFGRCLEPGRGPATGANDDEVLVVFQRERLDRKHSLQPSVFIAWPSSEFLAETLVEGRGLPSLRATQRKAQTGNCFRIETHHRLMSDRPIRLRPERRSLASQTESGVQAPPQRDPYADPDGDSDPGLELSP
jgi:hypothetical protein